MNKRMIVIIAGLLILIVFFIVLVKINTVSKPEYLTITDATPNELFSEDKLTSVGVINEFFKALNEGNVIKLNEQYSSNYFKNNDLKTGYTDFSKQKITNIKVKLLEKSTENEKFYEVIFTIVDNTAPPFLIAGEGEKTYFINLINENGDWKINDITTSP